MRQFLDNTVVLWVFNNIIYFFLFEALPRRVKNNDGVLAGQWKEINHDMSIILSLHFGSRAVIRMREKCDFNRGVVDGTD